MAFPYIENPTSIKKEIEKIELEIINHSYFEIRSNVLLKFSQKFKSLRLNHFECEN